MKKYLTNSISDKIQLAGLQYYKLLLVVAPSGSGKTIAFQNVSQQKNIPYINLNLELSRNMLELTYQQQIDNLPQLFQEIVDKESCGSILLDNIEMLFYVGLEQDPLRLLQMVSREKIIIVAWNGKIVKNNLTYAELGHPEYRQYSIDKLICVTPEQTF